MVRGQSTATRASMLLAFFALGAFLIYATVARFNVDKPSIDLLPSVGKPAPRFTLQTIDGQKVDLASERGHIVVLAFWATYSPPSRAELVTLQSLYAQFHKNHVDILTVDVGEDPITVSGYLNYHHMDFPVAMDVNRDVTVKMYRIQPIPTTFVLDEQGIVRYRATSQVSAATLNAWVSSVASQSKGGQP